MNAIASRCWAAALLVSPVFAAPASAATYVGNFSSLGSQGSPSASGLYFFTGHSAAQTLTGTGLSSVGGLTLQTNAGRNGNYATQPITFGFTLNGLSIGSTTFNPGDSATRLLTFNFGTITTLGQNYTLTASVTQGVEFGAGAIQFATNAPLTLIEGTAGAVPEPATWAMMMLGFGMVGFGVRRRAGKVTTRVAFG